MIRSVQTLGICALALLPLAPAHAQTNPLTSEGWTFAAGPAVLVRPAYQGSDRYEITPLPGFIVTYDGWLFVDPARGAGVQSDIFPGVRVSGGLDYMFGRDEDEAAILQGMGDLDGGLSAFGGISLQPFGPMLSFDVRAEAPFTGEMSGAEFVTEATAHMPLGDGLLSIGAGAAWLTGGMMEDVFGVTPAQAAASFLPAYDPDGGLKSYRVDITGVQPLNERWSLAGVAGYERLTGDAADSPIVSTRNQFRTVFGVLYRF